MKQFFHSGMESNKTFIVTSQTTPAVDPISPLPVSIQSMWQTFIFSPKCGHFLLELYSFEKDDSGAQKQQIRPYVWSLLSTDGEEGYAGKKKKSPLGSCVDDWKVISGLEKNTDVLHRPLKLTLRGLILRFWVDHHLRFWTQFDLMNLTWELGTGFWEFETCWSAPTYWGDTADTVHVWLIKVNQLTVFFF